MTVAVSGESITFPDNSVQATAATGFGFKNRIINGAMVINQRGVTSGLAGGYFVDRWQITGLTTSSLITSSLPNNFTQAISINRTSAAGTMTAYQPIEAKNCYDLVGQSVALSFWAQNVTGLTSITANLSYANSADNFSAITSISTATISSSPSASWTYYTTTFTNLPSGAANGLQVQISGVTAGTGTLGITGVQLEKGSTATSFDYRPFGTELGLCQRYFYREQGGTLWYGTYQSGPGGFENATITGAFPVPMRAAPSLTFTGDQGYFIPAMSSVTPSGDVASAAPSSGAPGSIVVGPLGITRATMALGSLVRGVQYRNACFDGGTLACSAEL